MRPRGRTRAPAARSGLGPACWVAKANGIDSSAGPSVRALGYRLPDPSEHACRTGEATGFADNDPADATANAGGYEHLPERV